MEPHDQDIQGDHLSWSAVIQRIAIGVGGAVVFGAGTVIIGDTRKLDVHEERIGRLEASMAQIPEIDKGVTALNGKLDVVNQKLDDAKDALRGIPNVRIR